MQTAGEREYIRALGDAWWGVTTCESGFEGRRDQVRPPTAPWGSETTCAGAGCRNVLDIQPEHRIPHVSMSNGDHVHSRSLLCRWCFCGKLFGERHRRRTGLYVLF